MSESAVEDTSGATEVDSQGADTTAEDQEAQNLLDQMNDQGQGQGTPEEQLAHWKSMARKHERAARSNAAAADKWQKQEDANKSELQKAQEAQLAAEQERDALRSGQSRMLAAAAHDLPTDLVDYLGDGTAEEIGERAEHLSGVISAEVERRIEAEVEKRIAERTNGQGGRTAPAGTSRRPVTTLRPGAAPSSTGMMSPDQMFRQLVSGEPE
jgi:hypothetical protein